MCIRSRDGQGLKGIRSRDGQESKKIRSRDDKILEV